MANGVSVLPGAHYAILFLIGGTLLSTLIAFAIAAPVGIGAAIFLAEAVPSGPRLWRRCLSNFWPRFPQSYSASGAMRC